MFQNTKKEKVVREFFSGPSEAFTIQIVEKTGLRQRIAGLLQPHVGEFPAEVFTNFHEPALIRLRGNQRLVISPNYLGAE